MVAVLSLLFFGLKVHITEFKVACIERFYHRGIPWGGEGLCRARVLGGGYLNVLFCSMGGGLGCVSLRHSRDRE